MSDQGGTALSDEDNLLGPHSFFLQFPLTLSADEDDRWYSLSVTEVERRNQLFFDDCPFFFLGPLD